MSDRELLILAAKAAGIRHIQPHPDYSGALGLVVCDEHERPLLDWRPLTDDGDALRLAVKLGMRIDSAADRTGVFYDFAEYLQQNHGDDPYAATRRAIVRAAAEIGRAQ